jgi:hypothetical protein
MEKRRKKKKRNSSEVDKKVEEALTRRMWTRISKRGT